MLTRRFSTDSADGSVSLSVSILWLGRSNKKAGPHDDPAFSMVTSQNAVTRTSEKIVIYHLKLSAFYFNHWRPLAILWFFISMLKLGDNNFDLLFAEPVL